MSKVGYAILNKKTGCFVYPHYVKVYKWQTPSREAMAHEIGYITTDSQKSGAIERLRGYVNFAPFLYYSSFVNIENYEIVEVNLEAAADVNSYRNKYLKILSLNELQCLKLTIQKKRKSGFGPENNGIYYSIKDINKEIKSRPPKPDKKILHGLRRKHAKEIKGIRCKNK